MNTLETIFTRKSVRQFKNQKVDEKEGHSYTYRAYVPG